MGGGMMDFENLDNKTRVEIQLQTLMDYRTNRTNSIEVQMAFDTEAVKSLKWYLENKKGLQVIKYSKVNKNGVFMLKIMSDSTLEQTIQSVSECLDDIIPATDIMFIKGKMSLQQPMIDA